jgi:hypothetical protein
MGGEAAVSNLASLRCRWSKLGPASLIWRKLTFLLGLGAEGRVLQAAEDMN